MHPNEALVTKLYTSFQNRDAKAMASCYAKDASFSDAVFTDLHGSDVAAMWGMLAAAATKDLSITFQVLTADDNSASAHWEATYMFSRTGRRVHNKIDATFEIADGKIVRHVDAFSFWRWSRQALGPTGLLLGWTPLVRNRVRRDAARGLATFKEKVAEMAAAAPAKAPRKAAKKR